jgi:hypothetical protein
MYSWRYAVLSAGSQQLHPLVMPRECSTVHIPRGYQ